MPDVCRLLPPRAKVMRFLRRRRYETFAPLVSASTRGVPGRRVSDIRAAHPPTRRHTLVCSRDSRMRSPSMVLAAVTLTFSNLVLQIIVGAIAAAFIGRAMGGAGFGIMRDLVVCAIGALGANFAVIDFGL